MGKNKNNNLTSKKWLFVVDDDICHQEYCDIFKNLVRQSDMELIYFAYDEISTHWHVYFEFKTSKSIDYLNTFLNFDCMIDKFDSSLDVVYSYLESTIKQGALYSFFRNGKIVVNEIKNDTLIDVRSKDDIDSFRYNICVKNKDGSFETYYFVNKTGLDFISSLLKKTGVEYIIYQKIKKGD